MKQTSALKHLKRNAILASMMLGLALSSCNVSGDSDDDYAPQPSPIKPQEPAPAGDDNGKTNPTKTETGSEVDTKTGVTYYTTTTTDIVKSSKVAEDTKTLSGENVGATIALNGSVTLNIPDTEEAMKKAVSADVKTTIYKDDTIATTKYYTDEKRTVLANREDSVVPGIEYHAEVVVSNQDLKIMIKSQNYPTTKTVDVKQYFDAKTQLDAVVNMATVNFDENPEDTFKKRAVDLVKEYAESEGITDLANDKITFTGITSVTPRYSYDYESDLAHTTFNVKMSDVGGINTGVDISVFPNVENRYYADTEMHKEISLISGVTMDHHLRLKTRNANYIQKAIKFSNDVKSVNMDLNNKNNNLLLIYKGGIIAPNATLTLSNFASATLSGKIFTEQLENNKLLEVLKTSNTLPAIDLSIEDSEDRNLYGIGVEKIVDNYYNKNKSIQLSFANTISFNAKKFLEDKGENMFSETGYNKDSAYELSANAAALMMNSGVDVSNVAITGTNSTGKTSLGGTRTNIYTTTDWSSITNLTGEDRGIIYFANKTPSNNVQLGGNDAKVILGDKDAYNASTNIYSARNLDISALDKTVQESIDFSTFGGTVYFHSEIDRPLPNDRPKAFIFGSKYRGVLSDVYTNAAWEKYGNTKNDADLKAGKVDASKYSKISLLNDIELSPVEKLLFNNQRTYG